MSANHSERLISRSPSLLVVLDDKLTSQRLSAAWEERLGAGVSRDGLSAADLFDLDDNPELGRQLSAAAQDGTPFVDTAAGVRLREGVIPCKLAGWRVEGEGSEAPAVVVSATDVSDYEDAATRFAQLQTQHRVILDSAGEGIYGLDREGRLTFGNRAAEDIIGWRTENILGQKVHDVHHHTHADGTPYLVEDCPLYAALTDGEVHTVDDEVFWHANGAAIPVEYTSTPILKNGKPDGAVVIFRNVSHRRELERQRAQAFTEIQALKEQLEQERDYLRDEINVTLNFGEIIGESAALKRTLAQIEAVAPTSANVLVLGESGVGKEMIARAIHSQGDRADHPLVKVNCASIPKDLFESEFFGHVKGAFTGAHRDRTGRLQLAHGGTLFLDEVGEIPLSLQGKLLRALQEQEFERVGDDRTIKVDVRVVAATNRNLADEVEAGRFRQDLFYRLSVFPIEVPPLRERVDDIGPLATHFLGSICKELGREPPKMTRRQLEMLCAHRWPGNIRELRNVIERAVISSPGAKLRLDLALSEPSARPSVTSAAAQTEDPEFLTETEIRDLEKANLVAALEHASWKVWGENGAAELLGIKPSTLSYRMKNFGIVKSG
jgi:PAS domain S-box-containing protein